MRWWEELSCVVHCECMWCAARQVPPPLHPRPRCRCVRPVRVAKGGWWRPRQWRGVPVCWRVQGGRRVCEPAPSSPLPLLWLFNPLSPRLPWSHPYGLPPPLPHSCLLVSRSYATAFAGTPAGVAFSLFFFLGSTSAPRRVREPWRECLAQSTPPPLLFVSFLFVCLACGSPCLASLLPFRAASTSG